MNLYAKRRRLKALIAFVVASLVTTASAWLSPAAQQPAQPPANKAAKVFRTQCALCHGDHGQGTDVGKTLNVVSLDADAVQKQSDAALRQVIVEGKNRMPPFGEALDAPTVDQLLGLVREFKKPAADLKQPGRSQGQDQ